MKKLLFLLTFLLFTVFLSIPSIKVLSISERKNPTEKYYSRQAYINGFYISYTHSVNKGRIHDFYTCTKDHLLMDKTIFVSYGAGIPEPEETPGAIFTVLPNGYQISNLQRKVDCLTMAVGLIANHTIAFSSILDENLEIPLNQYFKPQTSILLKTEKISIFNYMFCKKIHKI